MKKDIYLNFRAKNSIWKCLEFSTLLALMSKVQIIHWFWLLQIAYFSCENSNITIWQVEIEVSEKLELNWKNFTKGFSYLRLSRLPLRVTSFILKFWKSTVFENHRKSLIQHCEQSELRLHFQWTKVHKKCPNSKIQMRLFGPFSNTVDAASFSAAPTSSFILYLSVDSQKVFVNCSSVKSWVRCNECDLQVGPTLVSPLGGDKCVAFNANRSRQRTYNHQYPQCLKITDTVSFYIASEAS